MKNKEEITWYLERITGQMTEAQENALIAFLARLYMETTSKDKRG